MATAALTITSDHLLFSIIVGLARKHKVVVSFLEKHLQCSGAASEHQETATESRGKATYLG